MSLIGYVSSYLSLLKTEGVIGVDSTLSQRLADAKANPLSSVQLIALAKALSRSGYVERAKVHATQVYRLGVSDGRSWLRLGDLLLRIGLFDLAESAVRNGLTQKPGDINGRRNLSVLLERRGEIHEAQNLIRQTYLEQPIRTKSSPAGKPKLLRIRYLDGGAYQVRRTRGKKTYSKRLMGGTFQIANFIDESEVAIDLLTLTRDTDVKSFDLTSYEVVLNQLACADACAPGFPLVEELLTTYPSEKVINHPSKVKLTTREGNAERLSVISNAVFPKTVGIPENSDDESVLALTLGQGMAFPLIVRERETHVGKSMVVVQSTQELLDTLRQPSDRGYLVIQFYDLIKQDGLYDKYRVFFINGQLYPINRIVSDDWNIHGNKRYKLMLDSDTAKQGEQAFLEDPESFLGESVFNALQDVRDTIDLEFFGVDFSVDKNERLVLFEANASMRHAFEHVRKYPYLKPHLEAASEGFRNMVMEKAGV
ncbi:MAG: hypothetical protein JJ957_10905 [Pseudomonadales bacterium]|nr:hypothetical protein [Pseudomonadales bacterium]MBO6595993.1 hypothetical protein [Pseudomonadales bacterium]MBO6822476.1 hypothetical protein [Pseudomonadales bacterium]